jgi:hypothetical protein
MWKKRRSLRRVTMMGDLDFVRMLSRFSANVKEVSFNE